MLTIPVNHPSEEAKRLSKSRWNQVAKPLNSMGLFEDLVVRIAGIQGTENVHVAQRCALVFCGDHGIVAEGVSQSGSDVTALVARSVAQGTSNINLMAKASRCDVFGIDVGMLADIVHPNMLNKKIGYGTQNFALGPAMTRLQAETAVNAGIDTMRIMKERGYEIALIGEMGIGNTTSTAAISAVLLGADADAVVGRGSGLSDRSLEIKRRVVKTAIEMLRPDPRDPLDILSKVGGFEIAAMTGAFLGAMIYRIPAVIDGVISSAAALLAERLCPACRNFRIPSHCSNEPAGHLLMNALRETPVLQANLALGEGTGAVLMLPLLDLSLQLYNGVHTFDNLGMEAYTPQGKAKQE